MSKTQQKALGPKRALGAKNATTEEMLSTPQ
jgi:hypothetical protein